MHASLYITCIYLFASCLFYYVGIFSHEYCTMYPKMFWVAVNCIVKSYVPGNNLESYCKIIAWDIWLICTTFRRGQAKPITFYLYQSMTSTDAWNLSILRLAPLDNVVNIKCIKVLLPDFQCQPSLTLCLSLSQLHPPHWQPFSKDHRHFQF